MAGVAKVVVGELVKNVISQLSLIKGAKKDVEDLKSTLTAIEAVLKDAESTQLSNNSIRDWLMKIKDAAYDAEDVLDEWISEQEEVTTRGNCICQVIHSILTCFNFNTHINIAKKLKSVVARFDEIAKEKSNFHFNTSDVSSQMEIEFTRNRECSSTSSQPKIYGREADVNNIVDMLLQKNHRSQEDIFIIPIVGYGGVGKTTLAQLAYNHPRIVDCFKPRIWVSVSDPFDVKRVLKQILDSFGGCNSESLDFLQNKVFESLKDKKYFIVLDDVWSENKDTWNKLRSSLASGAKGSSIMVTTRLPTVASIVNNASAPYNLGVLTDEDCWSLLKSCALGDNGEEQPPNLVRIGMEIAKKCKGIPLAAKSLGSLLNLKNNESYWTHVRDHPIWKLDNDEGKIILAVLRLSYNHLPSHLKQCFSYSSIDPKDSEMDKTKLIYLWMANGFIQPQGRLELEEVGDDIFHELLRRSFFQDTEEDGYGNIQSFKMHDLMHDLTCSVAENECLITEVGGVKDVPKTIRHLSVIRDSEQSLTVIDPVIVSELSFCTLFFRTLVFFCTLFFEPINFHSFKFSTTLRVLNLCDMRLATLPPSICELKYLRYLDLSCNDLASLPESLCRLRNLQMLDLSNNKITALPHSIGTLEKLRYLSLSYCYCLTSIPESIGNVVSLRYLSLYGCTGLTSIPESIGNVVSLRYLSLSYCYCLTSIPESIGNVVSLRYLDLSHCSGLTSIPESIGNVVSLRYLILSGCSGLTSIPEFTRNVVSLTHLNLTRCSDLTSIPESIGNVVSLRYLRLSVCSGLTSIPESIGNVVSLRHLSLCWCSGLTSIPESIGNVESLTHLDLSGCSGLTSIPESIGNVVSLTHLDLYGCSGLTSIPGSIGNVVSLRHLDLRACRGIRVLPQSICNLRNLQYLIVAYCEKLEMLVESTKGMNSLRHLDNKGCLGLKKMPLGLGESVYLQRLDLFMVGGESGCGGINELHGLNQLRGGLEMAGLENVRNAKEAKEANLIGKVFLQSLTLRWGNVVVHEEIESKEVLECLLQLLPPNLQKLKIDGYPGAGVTCFPQGLNNSCLTELSIWGCPNLNYVPEGLNSTLLKLEISGCKSLKSVSEGLQYLTSLQTLVIHHCDEVEFEANDFQHLISLRQLRLAFLPKLRALPEGTTMLQELHISDCSNLRRLPQGIQHITTLRSLTIRNCHVELLEMFEREHGEDWNFLCSRHGEDWIFQKIDNHHL